MQLRVLKFGRVLLSLLCGLPGHNPSRCLTNDCLVEPDLSRRHEKETQERWVCYRGAESESVVVELWGISSVQNKQC